MLRCSSHEAHEWFVKQSLVLNRNTEHNSHILGVLQLVILSWQPRYLYFTQLVLTTPKFLRCCLLQNAQPTLFCLRSCRGQCLAFFVNRSIHCSWFSPEFIEKLLVSHICIYLLYSHVNFYLCIILQLETLWISNSSQSERY